MRRVNDYACFQNEKVKTNYRYHTIITPEATQFCINYLKVHGLNLKDDDQFFTMKPHAVTSAYKSINNKMNWGKKGDFDFFSSHRVRKFNASAISNTDFAHYIQGRKPSNKMNEIYFKKSIEELRDEYEKYLPKFGIYARYDILINSEAYNQLLDEKNDLEQQLKETKEEYEQKIASLQRANISINTEIADIRNQMNNVGLQTQMIELQKRAAQHELVTSTPGLMEYVMKIFEDQINLGERKYYSDAEIDDMVRLALATKNRIEKMENTLSEETLKEQYPEQYAEATEIINKYKEKYVMEELGVPLSDLQNEKVNKALLPFKKQVLEDKQNSDYIDENIEMLVNPSKVQDIIDEALGLIDSVEAIYDEGMGVNIISRFRY